MGAEEFRWIQSAQSLEQSRVMRFLPEMRPILLNYFGLAPGMDVLEVGCGPDTMASYLAEGIAPGKIIGLDLDSEFIQRATAKAQLRAISNVSFLMGDAYHLPFGDSRFDAVISYTGIGVLTNPEVAVEEMFRVCRPGGTISIAEAVTGRLGIGFLGMDSVSDEELFPGAERYHELMEDIQASINTSAIPGVGNKQWPSGAMFALLGKLGVTKIRFNARGYGSAPDDERVSAAERRQWRQNEHRSQRQWLEELQNSCQTISMRKKYAEVIELTQTRFNWLRSHAAYDWEAGVSIVVSGIKPLSL